MKETVYELDLDSLPPLKVQEKAELHALAARPDADIDCGDIPPLNEAFFKKAMSNPWFRPIKKSTTVRIDADVLAWLKSQGKGYPPASIASCAAPCWIRLESEKPASV